VLLKGIDNLTRQLRSRLGESLSSIEKAIRPVSTVTTSSWEALDYFSLAQAKRNEGKFPEAVKLYELALDKDPKFVAARSSLALVLIQFTGEKDKGKAMLTQALQDGVSQQLPERDLLPLKAVHRQFVGGDLQGALAEHRTIMELFPDLMPPYNNAGRILQALGRYDEAAAMYEEAARRAPKSSIPLQNAWFLHMNLRRDARAAEEVVRRYVSLAPGLAATHSFLGYNLAVEEKFDEAEKELRKALEIEPEHPYALANLGHVLYAAGRASEAVPVDRRVLDLVSRGKLSGTPEWDCVALALALRESGQVQEAVQTAAEGRDALTKKLQGKPPGSDDWLAYGALAAVGGDIERAVTCISKAAPSGIKDSNSLMDLAELYAMIGRPAQAIEYIKKSLAGGFSDPFFPVILPEFQSIRKHPEFRELFKLGH
jgi:tetratricopeptide (TPR) repeat protein